MPSPPKTQNAVQPKKTNNLPPRKAEVYPKISTPTLQRQNASLQEDSDTEIDDVDEEHPKQNVSQKARHDVVSFQHDPNDPFRVLNVLNKPRSS